MKRNLLAVVLLLSLSALACAASMSARVRQVPKDIQEKIFVSPKETLPALVKFLAGGGGDAGAGPQGYETVLEKRRAICIGYSNLLSVMCSLAGIECEIVCGWSKGFNYPGYLYDKPDHSWNAVKLGGRWKLLDVTWDAGFVDVRHFVKRYSLQWYNLTPAQFIYSHLPEEEKWQLLSGKDVRSRERFVEEPYVPGIFFEYGLSFGKDAPDYTNEISGATGFDIVAKGNVSTAAFISGGGAGADMSFAVWQENSGSGRRFIFDVPDGRTYRTQIGARLNGNPANPTFFQRAEFEGVVLPEMRGLLAARKITKGEAELFERSWQLVEENGRYYFLEDQFDGPRNQANSKVLKNIEHGASGFETVLNFEVKAAPGYGGYGVDVRRFPRMYAGYMAAQTMSVESPLKGTLRRGDEEHFSVRTGAYSSLLIFTADEKYVRVPKNAKSGAFELDFKIPEDAERLDVFASKDGRHFTSLFSYALE